MTRRWRPRNEGIGPFSRLNLTMATISTAAAVKSLGLRTHGDPLVEQPVFPGFCEDVQGFEDADYSLTITHPESMMKG